MSRDLLQYEKIAKKDFNQKELERLGLTPEEGQYEQIIKFFCMIYDEVEKTEILPKKLSGDYFTKYFCDAIQPLLLLGFEFGATFLNIKAGAGFPSLPIAIFRPDLKTIIVESDKKKFEFLKETVEVAEIKNVTVLNSINEVKGTFDYVVENNCVTLQDFTRRNKKYIKDEGRLYTNRTENFEEELGDITANKSKEGVGVSEIAEYDLANKHFGLNLVSFELYNK